jgi:hypothetical protein
VLSLSLLTLGLGFAHSIVGTLSFGFCDTSCSYAAMKALFGVINGAEEEVEEEEAEEEEEEEALAALLMDPPAAAMPAA